jgi:hypothetical protein
MVWTGTVKTTLPSPPRVASDSDWSSGSDSDRSASASSRSIVRFGFNGGMENRPDLLVGGLGTREPCEVPFVVLFVLVPERVVVLILKAVYRLISLLCHTNT